MSIQLPSESERALGAPLDRRPDEMPTHPDCLVEQRLVFSHKKPLSAAERNPLAQRWMSIPDFRVEFLTGLNATAYDAK
jgi:hypothetical protein